MSDRRENLHLAGVAGLNSVSLLKRDLKNAALTLLRERSTKTGKRKRNEDTEDKDAKVAMHCTSHSRHSFMDKEKTNAALGFSENHAISEMRLCLARHDWTSLRQLFPFILGCYGELESVIWRYILTILLCTPERDSSHLQEFLEMCLGAQSLEDGDLLERLLTLHHRDTS